MNNKQTGEKIIFMLTEINTAHTDNARQRQIAERKE